MESEILPRFRDAKGRLKVLIISNPNWSVGAKELLSLEQVIVFELGYFVNEEDKVRATNDVIRILRSLLGYVINYSINNVYSSSNGAICTLDKQNCGKEESKLDKWIGKSGSSEERRDKKGGLPKLDCSNCTNNHYCESFSRLKVLEGMKPKRMTEQTSLFNVSNRSNVKPYKVRMKEWGDEYYPLWIKCGSCSNRRAYIHKVLGHKQFDEEEDEDAQGGQSND